MTPHRTVPTIETDRLILRPPLLDDFARWSELMADSESARFIGGVMPRPIAWRILMQTRGAWELTGISMFSVVEKRNNVWIGRVGPWQPCEWPGTEIGWALHRDAWGKGYALEAAMAATEYAFHTLGWTDVIHCIDPANTASQRLAFRLGSRILRQTRMPPPFDHDVVDIWGQSRDEWIANQSERDSALIPLPSHAKR